MGIEDMDCGSYIQERDICALWSSLVRGDWRQWLTDIGQRRTPALRRDEGLQSGNVKTADKAVQDQDP